MTVSAQLALRFGVRFNPTPEEALSLYLRRWIVGGPLPADTDTTGIINEEAKVYEVDPNVLAAAYRPLPKTENRFFFTACRRRKAGKGYRMTRTVVGAAGSWVTSVKKMVRNGAGETIGYYETLHYKYKDDRSRRKSDQWLMEEYHLDGSAVAGADHERVLCRLYSKSKKEMGSATVQQSAAAASGDRRLDLGMQEPGSSTMAAAAVQVQPRRQEPVALPAMKQPQAIKKPPVLEPRVTVPKPVAITPARAAKRPAPKGTEPPRPKRMLVAAALPALEVPPRTSPRHDVVGYNTPKKPAWYTAVALRLQAPTATRKSSRSPLPAPSRPATAEAPTVEEDHSIIKEEALDGDNWLDCLLESYIEVEEPQKEEHAKIQDEEEGHQHQHATSSLEGLEVDERGDEVVAQDLFDGLKDDIDDPIDGEDEDWRSRPLSDYNETLPY